MNKALVSSVNFDILCRHSLSWRFPVLCSRWNRKMELKLALYVRLRDPVLDAKAMFQWVEQSLGLFPKLAPERRELSWSNGFETVYLSLWGCLGELVGGNLERKRGVGSKMIVLPSPLPCSKSILQYRSKQMPTLWEQFCYLLKRQMVDWGLLHLLPPTADCQQVHCFPQRGHRGFVSGGDSKQMTKLSVNLATLSWLTATTLLP